MALAASAFHSRGVALPEKHNTSQLLSVEDGIGVVSIEGPILRKPDIFDRVILGATSSVEIGQAIREAAGRDDIKAVMLLSSETGHPINAAGRKAGAAPHPSAAASGVRVGPWAVGI